MSCARATTAAEARFRIEAANSRPRTASLIALDAESAAAVREAAALDPARRRIVALAPPEIAALPMLMQELAVRTRTIVDEAARSDLVVMVARAGYAGHEASLLGEACRLRHTAVTAVVVAPYDGADAAVAATLARLRPFATMLVVVGRSDYLGDMLEAMRA